VTATTDVVPIQALGAGRTIDAFEASLDGSKAVSRPGVEPARNVSWFEARDACEASGRRLCTEKEWLAACTGTAPVDEDRNGILSDDPILGRKYGYGEDRHAGACADSRAPDDKRAGAHRQSPPVRDAGRNLRSGRRREGVGRTHARSGGDERRLLFVRGLGAVRLLPRGHGTGIEGGGDRIPMLLRSTRSRASSHQARARRRRNRRELRGAAPRRWRAAEQEAVGSADGRDLLGELVRTVPEGDARARQALRRLPGRGSGRRRDQRRHGRDEAPRVARQESDAVPHRARSGREADGHVHQPRAPDDALDQEGRHDPPSDHGPSARRRQASQRARGGAGRSRAEAEIVADAKPPPKQ
jgi:hypothetical protein